MAKTRKIARRVGESSKIEGWGNHKWRPNQANNASKVGPKTDAENHLKMKPIWMKLEATIQQKWHPTIDVFLARFSDASGNIGGTAAEPRRSRGVAVTEPRVAHFLQPTPQGGAILSKNIVQ